jgi:PKD repeat protein
VNNPPTAYFVLNPAQPQAGNDVQVTCQSTDANGDPLNYTWSRDGQALTQYAGQQKWKWPKAPEGGHVINLVVSDGKGGTDSYSKRIKIIGGSQPADDTKKKWKVGPFSCFIATATYGSETAQELDTLRGFRDQVLLKSEPGKWFVTAYYRLSPPLAEFIATHEAVRIFVRKQMLDPVVYVLKQTRCLWDRAIVAQ